MKTPKLQLPSSLLFSLIFLTPLVALTELVRAENVNSPTAVRAKIENTTKSIDFSPNLGQKLQNEFLMVKPRKPSFSRFTNGPGTPVFSEFRILLHDSQPENISALQTFESLLG